MKDKGAPKPKKNEDNGPLVPCTECHHAEHLSVSDGFHVGDDYPKTLAQRQEDIYGGNMVDLVDSTSERLEEYNNPYSPNVVTSLHYDQHQNGSVNVTSLSVTNSSDHRVFVMNVTMCFNDQCYRPNPLRVGPQMNSDKFMTIDPQSNSKKILVPSGNPFNPNNHFGPSNDQKLTVYVRFRFQAPPNEAVLTFKFP